MLATRLALAVSACCLTAAAGEPDLRFAEDGFLRARGRAAFYRADYDAMAKAYAPLAERVAAQADAAAGNAQILKQLVSGHLDDLMGVGHAHQLADRWREAVAAYQQALSLIGLALKAGAVDPSLVRQRAYLVSVVGRIQRDALTDLPAAAATLAKGTDFSPFLRRSLDDLLRERTQQMARALRGERMRPDLRRYGEIYYPLATVRELALTQQRMGRATDALETLARADLALLLAHAPNGRADLGQVGDILRSLPRETPLPRMPSVMALSPARPKLTLRLDDPKTLARCHRTYVTERNTKWHFAFAPPPGQELATVDVGCDIEQFQNGFGGQFTCWADSGGERRGSVNLGSIHWPNEVPPGRQVRTKQFDVPAGAGLVRIEVSSWKEKFRTHGVTVRATFRPRQPAHFGLKLRIQSEALPEGGVLTCSGQPVPIGAAFTDLDPGIYEFAYRAAGREDVWRCRARMVGGGVYGLFVNLDSPFQWQLTTLRGVGEHPPGRPSLVRRADGTWLAAYSTGSAIRMASSKDGVTWEEPWPLPHETLARRVEPTLYADGKGSLWLACFSDRLRSATVGTGGYTLWLRRSQDGRTWSLPRPVRIELGEDPRRPPWLDYQAIGGSPWGAVHLTRGPDGRCWLFWRDRIGSGPSPDRLEPLRQYRLEGARLTNTSSPHVTIDARGRFHMVFLDHRRGICYAASADGRQWTAPVSIVEGVRASSYGSVQLVLDRERAALLYSDTKGGWWRRGTLEPKPAFGPPVKITNHVIPPCGSRACVTPDGTVALLTGSDTVWLLTAPLTRLTRPAEAEF